jgi:GNAT superfamily N-acetyltransferase
MSSDIDPVSARRAVDADVPALAAMLGAAFATNALVAWMFPDEAVRRRVLPRLHALQLRQDHLPHGIVDVAECRGALVGVAVWGPPGSFPVPLRRQLAQIPAFLHILGWHAVTLGRRFGAVASFERLRPHQPHWYFAFMAVSPDHQRRGISTALVEHGLRRVDAAGLPTYGDLTAPYYAARLRGFGFRTHDGIRVSDAPQVYPVSRPARAS